jgi:hypothetical protein
MEIARLPETQTLAIQYTNAKVEIQKIDKILYATNDKKVRHRLLNGRHYFIEVIKAFGKYKYSVIKKVAKRVYLRACIATDCKGFLDDDYKCGLCNVDVCRDCHEIKVGLAHICKNEHVESVKLIKQEARPCPKCSALISKIDGCDQMWCTQCHVTFSWTTGLIEKGVTHNPHFYEWARKNGTLQRADIPNNYCNNYPNFIDLYRACLKHNNSNEPIMTLEEAAKSDSEDANITVLLEYHRLVHHIKAAQIDTVLLEPNDNYDLRVRYMANELHADRFKQLLSQRDRLYRKNISGRFIYDMVYQASGDLFRNIISGQNLAQARADFRRLFMYGNECLRGLEDRWCIKFNEFKY